MLPELPRYSDKYRPSSSTQPTLKRKDLHAPFFPTEIFEDYFNPKRRRKGRVSLTLFFRFLINRSFPAATKSGPSKVRLNLDDLADDVEEVRLPPLIL